MKKKKAPGWLGVIATTELIDLYNLFYSTPAVMGSVGTLQKTLNTLTHHALTVKDIRKVFKSNNPIDFLSGVVAVTSIALTVSLRNKSKYVLTRIPLILGLQFGIIFAIRFIIKENKKIKLSKYRKYDSLFITPLVSSLTSILMNYSFDKFFRRYVAPTVDKIELDNSLKIDKKLIGKIITGLLIGFITGVASVALGKLVVDYFVERKKFKNISFKEFALKYVKKHLKELLILGIVSSLIGAGFGRILGNLVAEVGEDARAKELVKILELGTKKVKISPPSNKINLNKLSPVIKKFLTILEPILTGNTSKKDQKMKEIEGKQYVKIPLKGTKFVILVDERKLKKKKESFVKTLEKLKKALKILDNRLKSKAKEVYENLPDRIYVLMLDDIHFNAFSYNSQLIGILVDPNFYPELTTEEIAAILAHELNHSYRNHAALGTAVRFTLIVYALLMAFVALFLRVTQGTQKGFYVPARAILPLLIASNYNYFIFNRFMEMESDAFAADVMGDAALSVMTKMHRKFGRYDLEIPFDEIHGKLSYRVKEIRARLRKTAREK